MSSQFPSSPYRTVDPYSPPNYKQQPNCPSSNYEKAGKTASESIGSFGKGDYPTPFPSSSIGRVSSPVRSNKVDAIPSSPAFPGQLAETSPKFSSKLSSPSRHTRVINAELDPSKISTITVGRNSSQCDVALCKNKFISRVHASITYLPQTNEVKIHCFSMNGLIVTYRKQFDCYQLKDTMNNNNRAYRLVPRFSNEKCVKEIQEEGGFINFTLEKGDTVYMTYYKGIMLDFRQVFLRISLKEKNSSSEPLRFEKKAEFESESETKHMGSIRKHPLIFTDTSMDRPKKILKDSNKISIGSDSGVAERMLNHFLNSKSSPLSSVSSVDHEEQTLRQDSLSSDKNPMTMKKPKLNKRVLPSKPKKSVKENLDELSRRNIDVMHLQHILTNHLAFANVQQTPLFQLQQVNSQISELSRDELRSILSDAKCVGVIYRHGKDAAGKPLDEEYFYDLENDDDYERRNLVSSLKGGRTGLRSCRRTHKQYFWKKPAK
ncbi:BAF_collapsed_G0040690.mRNA.1.CDS.1 [Saccharomyces cerevisiae]|nr:BAF_collapsed_G0040690.mRNA.1.CDS.1 [Saccharomyces cerevisiae]